MSSNVATVLKARFSLPTDLDLDKEAARADLVKSKNNVSEPALQRIVVHRGYLLKLMAVAYVLYLADNCWSMATEFKAYDAIVRCPDLPEPDFLQADFELRKNAYYTGWWETCGETEAGKQYHVLGQGEKAVGSWCFWSAGQGESYLLVPFSNIADTTVTNMTTFNLQNLDVVNASTQGNFGVYTKVSPSQDTWYDAATAAMSSVAFTAWRTSYQSNSSFTPSCGLNQQHVPLSGFETFSLHGQEYEVHCFTDEDNDGNPTEDVWYYWPQGEAFDADYFDWETVIYYTYPRNEGYTGMNQCDALPPLERSCCTTAQVLISAKLSPDLIKVRKAIAIIKVTMNAVSAVLAIAAALKWVDVAASRKFVLAAWLAPFVVTCVMAMLPLATLANLKSAQAYDDTLIKSFDDADLDGLVKYFNILMPDETEYMSTSLKQLYSENKYAGRELSDVALQIEFRLKTMTATLIPLALTALALPGAITKASIQVKEVFPSSAWIGWLIRLMPVFYLPWATAIFCSLSQIFSGPFVTCSVACFLLMKVIDLTYKPSVHTNSYASYNDYRTARRPSKGQFVVLKTLLVASVAFLIVALLTDKYLKQLGVKALVGEVPNLTAETAHFIVKFIIGFLSKSSNSVVMFSDILLVMVAFVAAAPPSPEDQRVATALARMLRLTPSDGAPAGAI